ncbi:MAG TPA: dienelactone hydrolase family protein [Frankiaceae bacterium]|jgi:carboxymethylenebutenolidase|nr:dienelactone hydrolase family protein [Frankiaceae bacterium]
MPQHDVTIKTADGECDASLHIPEGTGPWPGVIMYPDAASLRDIFRGMGERLAGMGYVTLVPNIYYRAGEFAPFQIATIFSDPDERQRLGTMMSSLNRAAVGVDAKAFVDFLTARDEVTGTAVGTTGYCMGGGLSMLAAGLQPDGVAAAASFHGGNLGAQENPDSPYRFAEAMKAEIYVAAAENDPSFPPEQYQRLESALTAAGVRHTMETYPAGHGFAVPDNPTYDAAAEQRHWDALADLYSRLPR